MKTVKEFKKSGLVFVDGDVGSNYYVGGSNGFNEFTMFDRETPTEFAWRTNTGVKPEFVGDVELMDGNHNTGVKHSAKVNWEKHPQAGDASICQWRPHLPSIPTKTKEEKEALDKLESKPVYTQAMCDAGVKVIAGMTFTTEVGREYCAAMVNDKSVCFEDEDGFLVGMPIGRAKPIKTEREKAIEKACEAMSRVFGNNEYHEMARSLYDAGLLK